MEKTRELVKKNLWFRGYRVRDVSDITSYDLLVQDHIRVKIIERKAEPKKITMDTSGFDVLVVFVNGVTKKHTRFYARVPQVITNNEKNVQTFEGFTKNPAQAFGSTTMGN